MSRLLSPVSPDAVTESEPSVQVPARGQLRVAPGLNARVRAGTPAPTP